MSSNYLSENSLFIVCKFSTIKGISHIENICLLTLEGSGMIGTPGYTIGRIQILTMNSGFWVQKGEIIQYRNDALKPEWNDFKTILVEQGVDVSTNFLSSQDEVIRITQANQLY